MEIKTKLKIYEDKVNTNFQDKKVLKGNTSYNCFSLIILDSVIRINKKYYCQSLLEECKYKISKNKLNIILIKWPKSIIFNIIEYIRRKNLKVIHIDIDLNGKSMSYHRELPFGLISLSEYINIDTMNSISALV